MKSKVSSIDPTREQVYGLNLGEVLKKIQHLCDECGTTKSVDIDTNSNFIEFKVYQCMGCGSIMRQKLVWGANDKVDPNPTSEAKPGGSSSEVNPMQNVTNSDEDCSKNEQGLFEEKKETTNVD